MTDELSNAEVAADHAMRRVLYWGLIEVRALANQTRLTISDGTGEQVPQVMALSRLSMLANTLHHVPSHMPGSGSNALSWFTSLWEVRSPEQETWLLDVLARHGLSPLSILGEESLAEVEQRRQGRRG